MRLVRGEPWTLSVTRWNATGAGDIALGSDDFHIVRGQKCIVSHAEKFGTRWNASLPELAVALPRWFISVHSWFELFES